MTRIVLPLIIIAALSTPILQAKEELKILTTIKPVHSLVTAIGGDLISAKQIIPNNASPHHYSLKPSDLRRISNASLIFRIDPKLEGFLSKSLRSISKDKVITLSKSQDLTLLEAKESHDHGHEDDHTDEDDHKELDYHLWLNPDNAIAMATTINLALSQLAPKHTKQFAKNTETLINNIQAKHLEISTQLEEVKETPFLVMHDAWQYFTTHYQLKQLGTISAQERLKASAKALTAARSTLKNSNVKCLLAEPNLKQRTLAILAEGLPVKISEIDPLGRHIPDSDLAYPQLLQYTADKLLDCLK
jgi:zinc transport system substrate-binding protein